MVRDDVKKKGDEPEEKEDADAGVSDEALDLIDEDEDDLAVIPPEVEDDKGWE